MNEYNKSVRENFEKLKVAKSTSPPLKESLAHDEYTRRQLTQRTLLDHWSGDDWIWEEVDLTWSKEDGYVDGDVSIKNSEAEDGIQDDDQICNKSHGAVLARYSTNACPLNSS